MGPLLTEFFTQTAKSLVSPVVAGLIVGVLVSWQTRRSVNKREFLDRLNFSLNMIQDGQLKFRTLIEKPVAEVCLNPVITKMVRNAAEKTTKDDSLLPIKEDNYWLCLNALLNEVSEKFADGFLKIDQNPSIRSETYVMCITCEKAAKMRTRKIRAMLIKESLLLNFPTEDPQVEAPSHQARVDTLRQIARDYTSGERYHAFIKVDLCC